MEQEKKPIKSKRRICAEDGCLNSAFTLKKWFVKIRPCYQIDKVRFSFVLKTEKPDERGKISFDVYMEMDTFDNWCDDILNHTLEKESTLRDSLRARNHITALLREKMEDIP